MTEVITKKPTATETDLLTIIPIMCNVSPWDLDTFSTLLLSSFFNQNNFNPNGLTEVLTDNDVFCHISKTVMYLSLSFAHVLDISVMPFIQAKRF